MFNEEVLSTIQVFGFLAAVVGLIFTAFQIGKNSRTQRAILFKDLYTTIFEDDDVGVAFRLIETRELHFEDLTEAQAEIPRQTQKAIEKLLAHFEVICSLRNRRLLTNKDMVDFEYMMKRVTQYPGFLDYMKHIDDWTARNEMPRRPYENFFGYVTKRNEFFNLA